MPNVSDPVFYVYEHWRPDLDVCFWVGKGHGDRAYRFRRNFHYNNVIKKLARLGMCVEVRLVQSGIDEVSSFTLERERIAFWRGVGITLTNRTDGGEGPSGMRHSEKTRQVIKEKRKTQKIVHSEETRRKIGAANSIALKGRKNPEHSMRMKGRKFHPEHRARIGAGLTGRPVSLETREKIRVSNLGQKRSVQAREKMRQSQLGKTHSAETKKKMSESHSRRWALLKEEAT